MMLKKRYFALLPIVLAASCVSQPTKQTSKPVRQGNVKIEQTQTIQVKPAPVIIQKETIITPKPTYGSFSDWKSDFSMRAMSAGYSASDVQRLLGSAYLTNKWFRWIEVSLNLLKCRGITQILPCQVAEYQQVKASFQSSAHISQV